MTSGSPDVSKAHSLWSRNCPKVAFLTENVKQNNTNGNNSSSQSCEAPDAEQRGSEGTRGTFFSAPNRWLHALGAGGRASERRGPLQPERWVPGVLHQELERGQPQGAPPAPGRVGWERESTKEDAQAPGPPWSPPSDPGDSQHSRGVLRPFPHHPEKQHPRCRLLKDTEASIYRAGSRRRGNRGWLLHAKSLPRLLRKTQTAGPLSSARLRESPSREKRPSRQVRIPLDFKVHVRHCQGEDILIF